MNAVQFIEPQQRFTIRKDPVTIGTGVFTKLHPPRTEAEKDKKAIKIAMKVELFPPFTFYQFSFFIPR